MGKKSVTILSGTDTERDRNVADREPTKPAVEDADEIQIARAQAIGGVSDEGAARVGKEPRKFADIGKDDLRLLERGEIRDVVLNLEPLIPARLSTDLVSRRLLGDELWFETAQVLPNRRIVVYVGPSTDKKQPLLFV